MNEPNGGLSWRVARLERVIEATKPEVMVEQLDSLRDEVRSLRRAFYTFAFGVIGSAVVFAFSVFSLLGHH